MKRSQLPRWGAQRRALSVGRFVVLLALPAFGLAECLHVTVRDPDGLAVQGALVRSGSAEVASDETGMAKLCTDGDRPADVSVSAAGFAEASATASGPSLTVNLEIGRLIADPMVVTGTITPSQLAEIDRSLTVLSVRDRDTPAWSLADVLKQDSSVHLRERGADGTQADLSIRGSSFDQVLVLINGVRVSDGQTGHHTMDLPLPLESVEQVEVLHGSGATLYGSDAIGGTVNFVTKKPETGELKLMGGLGDFGWNRSAVSGGFTKGIWSQSFSTSRDFSTGFDEGRDFRNFALNTETFLDTSVGSTTIMFGYNDRPFGANNFYGPWNSFEETGTKFVSTSQTIGRTDKVLHRFNFAYRRHNDHFVLCKSGCVFGGRQFAPEDFQNFHTLDTYQGNYSVTSRLSDRVTVSAGAQYLSEIIDSTVAGQRDRSRGSAYVVFNLQPTDRLTLSAGVREEVWRKWRGQTSPNFSAGYRLGRGFKVRGQAGSAFRIPTFTDLYHVDPGNVGNPNLFPESAWNYEGGMDWYSNRGTKVSATWFHRDESNTIDWVKDAGSNVFQTRNFQELSFKGGEVSVRQRLKNGAAIWVNYTGMRASRLLAVNAVSRYVFNFPQNQATFGYSGSIAGDLVIKTQVGMYNRTWQSTRALWDFSLLWNGDRYQPFIQATNLANVQHEAFRGLTQPGRWIRGGIQIRVF